MQTDHQEQPCKHNMTQPPSKQRETVGHDFGKKKDFKRKGQSVQCYSRNIEVRALVATPWHTP